MMRKGLAITAATVLGTMLQVRAQEKPNILLVVSDDQSYPHAGAYGCPWVRTPSFDFVARNGILFTGCYTPNPKSAPSRACLLTGLYSWQLEEAGNHIGYWPEGKFPTLFEVLQEHGWMAGYTAKGWGPGDARGRALTGKAWNRRKVQDPPADFLSKYDYAANFADFLDAAEGRPWIFWAGAREPHRPYQAEAGRTLAGKSPEEIDRVPAYWPDDGTIRDDLLDYAFEIEYFDSQLGRMLSLLEEKGQLENTLVIVTSDNGMPFPRAKGNAYLSGVHVPLAIMWQRGLRNPKRTSDAPVSFVDFVPTLLELLEEPANCMEYQGASFAGLITGEGVPPRDHILLGRERHDIARPDSLGYPVRGILKDSVLYLRNFRPDRWPAGNPSLGYRDTDTSPTKGRLLELRRSGSDDSFWSLAFGKRPKEELYDLRTDPDCLQNLAGKPSWWLKKHQLWRLLRKELRAQGDPRITGKDAPFETYPYLHSDFDRLFPASDRDLDAAPQTKGM